MDNFALLIISFSLGMVLRRANLVPDTAPQTLNAVVVYLLVPALALLRVHSLPLSVAHLVPALMGWIVFFAGFGFFTLAGRLFGWPRSTVICLTLTGGLGNLLFIGVPLIEAFYGQQWVGLALIMAQGGTFPAMLVGMAMAAACVGENMTARDILIKIVSFPPTLAVIAAILLMPVAYPAWVESLLGKLSAPLAPLAIMSVGMSLRVQAMRDRIGPAMLGLAYKLLLAPLLIVIIYAGVFGIEGLTLQVTVFEAAMAPMVLGGIVCMQYDLDSDLAVTMLGLGTPIAFLTATGWFWALQKYFA